MQRGRRCKKRGRGRAVRVIACIVAQPLESSVGVGFSRQTLPGDLQVLIAVKRDADIRGIRVKATCCWPVYIPMKRHKVHRSL